VTQHSRDTPQFYLTAPSPCPYLPGRHERKVFTHLVGDKAGDLNDLLTHGGFRRSQSIAYRPACDQCRACVSVRVVAGEFRPSRNFRKILARNADVVGERIRQQGLSVQRVALGADAAPAAVAAALHEVEADVAFLDFFVAEGALRCLYAAADGVLANSEREPFGLVGLEVMGAGGVAFVGRTGEDYAVPYGNAVVVQSADPRELMTHLTALGSKPALAERIRSEGQRTAERYVWPRILDGVEAAWDVAAARG